MIDEKYAEIKTYGKSGKIPVFKSTMVVIFMIFFVLIFSLLLKKN